MAPTDLSPNADNLYIGGGELWFLPVGGTAPADWRDLGYVPELEFESSIERRPYYGRRGPIRQLVKNPVSSQAGTVRLRADEWSGPNVAMGFLGLQSGADETATIDIGAVTQVEGSLVLRNMTDIGPRWNMWYPSVSFAPNGVIAMLGDDYGGIPLVGEVNVVASLGAPVTAGSFVIGTTYTIASAGDTDFTTIGAADSNVGTVFTATGVGTGTGTATPHTGNRFGVISRAPITAANTPFWPA